VNVNPDKDPPAFEIIHRALIGFLDDSALTPEPFPLHSVIPREDRYAINEPGNEWNEREAEKEKTVIGNPYHRRTLLRYRERVNYHRLRRI